MLLRQREQKESLLTQLASKRLQLILVTENVCKSLGNIKEPHTSVYNEEVKLSSTAGANCRCRNTHLNEGNGTISAGAGRDRPGPHS